MYTVRDNASDGATTYIFDTFDKIMAHVIERDITDYTIEVIDGEETPVPMKTVTNLMSGLELEIPVDTPLCCDPSKETYWCM